MGSVNIDQGTPEGCTSLMIAAQEGHLHVIRILLSRGANVSAAADIGHLSAQNGHLAVTVDLIKAGADLDAADNDDITPLNLAARQGRSNVVAALIEAGADVNSRSEDGQTPLYMAALHGRLDAVKYLLRVNANPLLALADSFRIDFSPLVVAARQGHSEVVRELIQRFGIEGCGGASGGVDALEVAAAVGPQLDIMAMLLDAGVEDTGHVLYFMAGVGRQAPLGTAATVGGLHRWWSWIRQLFRDKFGMTPLFRSIYSFVDDTGVPSLVSPKVVRLLVDAGADTSSVVRGTDPRGEVLFHDTPLAFINVCILQKQAGGEDATEEQMYRLEAVRRLLMRVEAACRLLAMGQGAPRGQVCC